MTAIAITILMLALACAGHAWGQAYPDKPVHFTLAGSVPLGSTPEQLRARYQHWMGIFEKIARDAGVKPQ